MANERLVKLIRGHRVRIARALVRQVRAVVPRYEQLDSTAQERNFLSLLLGVERLLEFGDDAPLLEVAGHIAQMRVSMGFRVEDFSIAATCFLPVMRRFVIDNAENIQTGLDDYEQFESIALPFIGRSANIFLDAAEDPTEPNQVQKRKKAAAMPVKPVRIERVTGTEEEESTITNMGLPFSVRSAG